MLLVICTHWPVGSRVFFFFYLFSFLLFFFFFFVLFCFFLFFVFLLFFFFFSDVTYWFVVGNIYYRSKSFIHANDPPANKHVDLTLKAPSQWVKTNYTNIKELHITRRSLRAYVDSDSPDQPVQIDEGWPGISLLVDRIIGSIVQKSIKT